MKLPLKFQYWHTIFSPPNERLQVIARDQFGTQLLDDAGRPYHHVITFDVWLKQEQVRLSRVKFKSTIVKRDDGQLALAVHL